jgi:hypothetical protein
LVLPLFAITLFTSAFLLFLVQPIIGALILPKLGGTPQVWNTCMVFFQTVLLAGYAYTHASSTWLPTRRQVIVHCILLLLPLLVLIVLPLHGPFDISQFIPPWGANPIPATLLLLIVVVGLPFFVVATSAPLLQKWFASTGHPSAQDPYFLYAASNLGSMLGLLSYPLVVEPLTRLHATEHFDLLTQPWLWTAGYVILLVLFYACAAVVFRSPQSVQLAGAGKVSRPAEDTATAPPAEQPAAAPATQATAVAAAPVVTAKSTAIKKGSKQGKRRQQSFAPRDTGPKEPAPAPALITKPASDAVTPGRRLRWVALAAVPSSLMLGVITFVSTDISAMPLFWVLPLSLYLLSFILVFLRWPEPWVGSPHRLVMMIQPFSLLLLVYINLIHMDPDKFLLTMGIILLTFFLTALACHGELAKDRPSTKHLTEFYLWMSVGGMVGGMFNALVAPILFKYVWEFSLCLMVAGLVLPRTKRGGWIDNLLIDKSKASTTSRPAARGVVRKSVESEPANQIHTFLDIALPIGVLILAILLLFMSDAFSGMLQKIGRGINLPQDWLVTRDGHAGPFITSGTNVLTILVPLVIVVLFAGRPLRYGLGIGAVLLASGIYAWASDRGVVLADRSYFSIIRVEKRTDRFGTYTTLMHATTNHGMNFQDPKELRRLATTYYHRASPVGYVMDKMDWFPRRDVKGNILRSLPSELVGVTADAEKTDPDKSDPTKWRRQFIVQYPSDARMPASLVGLATAPLGVGNLPYAQLAGVWSEPAYATIGLGTGTMAVYAHPYQHMDFYEIDRHIRALSVPANPNQDPFFTNVRMALDRGVDLHVLMGDARLRMDQPWISYPPESQTANWGKADWEKWNAERWEKTGGPDHFYTAIIVDAFSSDAIPVHLITREAFKLYFDKLTEKGILCMHTSNRYLNLVRVCTDLANDMGYAWKRGHTQEDRDDPGHFSSEWVMIARKPEYLAEDAPRPSMLDPNETIKPHWDGLVEKNDLNEADANRRVWSIPQPSPDGAYIWSDDHHNMLSVFRPFMRRGDD